jgi:hypothetical protein
MSERGRKLFDLSPIIASSTCDEAVQSCARGNMDCFVARAPRNDGKPTLFHQRDFELGTMSPLNGGCP